MKYRIVKIFPLLELATSTSTSTSTLIITLIINMCSSMSLIQHNHNLLLNYCISSHIPLPRLMYIIQFQPSYWLLASSLVGWLVCLLGRKHIALGKISCVNTRCLIKCFAISSLCVLNIYFRPFSEVYIFVSRLFYAMFMNIFCTGRIYDNPFLVVLHYTVYVELQCIPLGCEDY